MTVMSDYTGWPFEYYATNGTVLQVVIDKHVRTGLRMDTLRGFLIHYGRWISLGIMRLKNMENYYEKNS